MSAVLEKIKKILKKTTNNSSEEEIKVAFEKAQKLAEEHSIDLATVKPENDNISPFDIQGEKFEIDFTTRALHHTYVLNILDKCFDLEFVWHTRGHYVTGLTFIGDKADVEIGKYCFGWLCDTFKKMYRSFLKRSIEDGNWVRDTHVNRNSYYYGLCTGIIQNNRRIREKVTQENQQYALVLVDKQNAVAAKKQELFPNIGKFRQQEQKINYSAAAQGAEDGQSLNLVKGIK